MIYSWDTEAVFSNETGTDWTLDVTDANLSTRLDEKDFVVAFDGVIIDNTQFTKLTPTTVRYDGTATGGVFVEFRRNTGVNPFRLATYTDVILSGDYNRNFERVSRKLAELDEFGAGEPGEVSIVDAAFGSGWGADSVNGASRAALFAKFEAETQAYTAAIQALDDDLQPQIDAKASVDSPNLTGSPTAPTPPLANNSTRLATTEHVRGNLAQYTNTEDLNSALDLKAPLDSPALTGVPTAPTADVEVSDDQVATTEFVRSVANIRHASISTAGFSSQQTFSDPIIITWGVGGGSITQHRGSGATASGYTIPETGFYSLSVQAAIVSSGPTVAIGVYLRVDGDEVRASQVNGPLAGQLSLHHADLFEEGSTIEVEVRAASATSAYYNDSVFTVQMIGN